MYLDIEIKDSERFVSWANKALGRMGIEAAFVSDDASAGEQHMLVCALHALRAWQNGSAITRTRGIETLLYAAGNKHVDKALSIAGLKEGKRAWTILFCPIDNERPSEEVVTAALGASVLEKEWQKRGCTEALERAALIEAF